MKRWTTTTAALAAAGALLVGSGGAASAQQPGRNGAVSYLWEYTYWMNQPCMVEGEEFPGLEPDGGVAWARGGTVMAMTAVAAGSTQTLVLSTSTCAPRSIGRADSGSTGSFSPDGKQIAVQRGGRILVVDVATGKTVRDLTAGKDPSWSPDGKRIAYVDGTTIKTRPSTGGSAATFKTSASAPDYSPDSTKIAYLTGGKIAYAAASNGSSAKTTSIKALDFTWSPDGTSFAFISPTQYVVVARTSGYITARPTDGDTPNVRQHVAWQPLR